ncbi:hypothetical protein PYW08_014448 [Mythimna loreyi]|uniref:Uncharacterized protein n=1 Tax=Mythimna loreyi TaxID=667449 RepID=A0ACC2R2Y0_9NEOP|nr:hypothetical protein PYW08_014448 [Mythimna loreyi]
MVKQQILLAYLSLCVGGLNAILYDVVSGKPANKTQLSIYAQRNNTGICTVDVKPCDPKEWQRLDGSCNNLKNPSRGTHRTPTISLLPVDFSPNYEPKKASDGGDLELPRKLRTELLCSGKVSEMKLTQLVAYYILFTIGDVLSIHDILNYVQNIPYCCTPEGKNDHRCTPIKVPVHDPVHRFSGINCLNLTRPQTFQTYGCLDNGTDFVRINFQTPIYDLSNIYNLSPGFSDLIRTFKNGLLKIETTENGLLFPESDPDSTLCPLNQRPRETRCHKYLLNAILGTSLIEILFYRQHNKIAEELHRLNPSWNDDRLFFTARNINIAISIQIFLYELLTILLGKRNLIKDGVICSDGKFRDLYDENIKLQMTNEYVYLHRWFHTIQEATMKFYDTDGHFVKTFPMVNATSRTGFLAIDDNFVQITQGSFRQQTGGFDYTMHSDMGNRILDGAQLASDVGSSDLTFIPLDATLQKPIRHRFDGRDMGREKGGMVPETLYCLMVDQLKRTIASDRYWYENCNRPHAFTKDQLKAIREVTIAGVLCWVGDHVTEIQPKAFYSISSNDAVFYDYYNGTKVSDTMLAYYNATGRLGTCTVNVRPCDAMELRRVDGTCNNLEHPSQGTFTVVHPRILPPSYFNGTYPRKAVSGKDLTLPRIVRVKLLCEGTSVNKVLTQAVLDFAIFAFGDVGSQHDIRFYLTNKTDCCTTGRKDYLCVPNIIPEDDPVHRFSGIRCMNLTRPLDFQYFGCTNDTVPSPIEQATAVYDLSPIYNSANKGDTVVRSFEGGHLLTEVENGVSWPPNGTGFCPANPPGRKCFKNYSNSLQAIQLFSTWFLRLHNYIADHFAEINRCWDDNQLFFIAREINIAVSQQIHIYEFWSLLVGNEKLMELGIASKGCGCRDFYDGSYPQTTLEYTLLNRWFHIIQDGSSKMYDTDGTFLKDYPIVNGTLRTGDLAEGRNIFYITQGKFRQPAREANHGVDPDIAERGLPHVQLSVDVPTSDLHKNRLFGLRPYVDYLHHCFGYKIRCWNDLVKVMDKDKIIIMQEVYEDVRDIDLLAGIWTERLHKGSHIPPTLTCLLMDSIIKSMKGDRHWFERCNRPHAFTHGQLLEIRKASLAFLLCAVGDGVTEIQRHAFENISPKNPLVSCSEIPKINFNLWANCTTT